MKSVLFCFFFQLLIFPFIGWGGEGDKMLAKYLELRTLEIEDSFLNEVESKNDWNRLKETYREQLGEMLGISPERPRTSLNTKITGKLDGDGFTVEKLHYQSSPGLYVSGNLYVPSGRKGEEKFPAILYLCGHGGVKKDGVSFGNKVHYHHHGAWFARNGYVCLTIDTIQLGEIEGIHHGTYSKNMWWWVSRGFTPAGVEAWNGMRGIDYLQTRPEVDPDKIGVTGRSGGGAYTWWIAALDERVKAAVPVAGITSMRNHVVDGCVESHCDCMYQVNTKSWDFAMISSLVAPRALLISNTDKDRIFPLEGVLDVHTKTRKLYRLLGAGGKLGLQITEGPHKDTQDLRVHAFSWFNRFLKDQNPSSLIEEPAIKYFEPEQLKVFETIPADEKTSSIHESFVPAAPVPPIPKDKKSWGKYRDRIRSELDHKVFSAWPKKKTKAEENSALGFSSDGIRFSVHRFVSQEPWELSLYLVHRDGLDREDLDLVVLNVLNAEGWNDFASTYGKSFAQGFPKDLKLPAHDVKAFDLESRMLKNQKWAMAYIAPRGIGPTAWSGDRRKRNQILRRFYLLGETLDGMRVHDIVCSADALRTVPGMEKIPLWMQSNQDMAANLLYASLYVPGVTRLDLHNLPESHRVGPAYLNVLRILDLPQAVAMACERTRVVLYQKGAKYDGFPLQVSENLEFGSKAITIRKSMSRD